MYQEFADNLRQSTANSEGCTKISKKLSIMDWVEETVPTFYEKLEDINQLIIQKINIVQIIRN